MHSKGLALTIIAVLLISPNSLLVRLIDMDVWSTAFWRGSTLAIGLGVLVAFMHGRELPKAFMAIGWTGLAIAVISLGSNFMFLAAIKYTSIANALVLLASMPLHAAVLSWFFLGERMPARTWAAMAFAVAGIAIIFADGIGGGSVFGDLMALLTALLLAAQLTMVRSRADVDMIPAGVVGSIMFAGLAILIGGAAQLPDASQMMWILIMGFVVLTPATALLIVGPRYISTPEVGLLVLLETVLGPLWAWMVIHEVPSPLAIVGGGVVVVTLTVHFAMSWRDEARRNRALLNLSA